MFSIGLFEILLVLSLALVILGPDKLFVLVRYLGLMLRKLRVLYTQMTDEFDRQLRLDEMLKSGPLQSPKKPSKKSKRPVPQKDSTRTSPKLSNASVKKSSKKQVASRSPTKSDKSSMAKPPIRSVLATKKPMRKINL
ncbi:MAG: hypothetical protein K0U41_09485 [Gammaproteobacteria bacterium]|nr:hypothetical protein [Gammaproteobacteria bacterium]